MGVLAVCRVVGKLFSPSMIDPGGIELDTPAGGSPSQGSSFEKGGRYRYLRRGGGERWGQAQVTINFLLQLVKRVLGGRKKSPAGANEE